MHGQRIGYIRVSTLDQQTELQLVGFRGRRFISMCGSMQESKSKLAPAHGGHQSTLLQLSTKYYSQPTFSTIRVWPSKSVLRHRDLHDALISIYKRY
jgi:hypothetical protein